LWLLVELLWMENRSKGRVVSQCVVAARGLIGRRRMSSRRRCREWGRHESAAWGLLAGCGDEIGSVGVFSEGGDCALPVVGVITSFAPLFVLSC